MAIDPRVAKNMAQVLNMRGFITCADFPICPQKEFGKSLCTNETILRAQGYRGGKLEPWNSSFRLSRAYDYGVLDSDWAPAVELLDAYSNATGLQLSCSGLMVYQLKPLMLGLEFVCEDGHMTNVDPDTIPYRKQKIDIHQIDAFCDECRKHVSSPYGTFRLFERFPEGY